MKKYLQILFVSGIVAIGTTVANAKVVGLLYDTPAYDVAMGVERSNDGDLYLRLDINGNPQRAEFGFSLGHALDQTAVVFIDEKPMLALSLMNGTRSGLTMSKDVEFVSDSDLERTTQRTNMTKDLIYLEQNGYLKDEGGKDYTLSEIQGLVFIYQVPAQFDATLQSVAVTFESLKDGELKQLLGNTQL